MSDEPSEPDPLKSIFGTAIELEPSLRAAFLRTACGADAELLAKIELLLLAHQDAGDFLAHPAILVAAATSEDPAELDDLTTGDRIGTCELIERLGRGGFGTVWRARQLRPVERDVALKILHGDGERVTKWFVAERQTLARMQHPGIASMFDAGSTSDGRPWLTMELVAGEPITRFCEQRDLSLAQRLELFIAVCIAVQHAHHKGVVHHDLKPANVLVAERDGAFCPVVIDFGVANALDDAVATDDSSTGSSLLPGTPEYMSPEQVAGDRATMDSRTDVYSLGVMLYELCSGVRPFQISDRTNGDQASDDPANGIEELLSKVTAGNPLPPSRACNRRLPREVDWITDQAMARDPADRYATATALAEDLRRLLANEAVTAGPNSATYRLGRLVLRHRVIVTAALLVVLSLAAGVGVAARGWWQASVAELKAKEDQQQAEDASRRANRALDMLDEMWATADGSRLGRADYPVRELLADCARQLPTSAAGEPEVELRVRRTLAHLQGFLGFRLDAEKHAVRVVELARERPDVEALAGSLLQLGRTRFALGNATAACDHANEATQLMSDRICADPDLPAAIDELLAQCAQRQGDVQVALAAAERALQLRRRLKDPDNIARSLRRLSNLHGSVGRMEPALAAIEEALSLQQELGTDHPDTIATLQHHAMLLQRTRDFDGAEAAFRDGLERRERAYGSDHPLVAWAKVDLAWVLHEQGKDRAAIPLLQAALPVLRKRLGESHVFVTETIQRLGSTLAGAKREDEADAFLLEAIERYRRLPDHPSEGLVSALTNLASMRWQQGSREDARRVQTEALEIAKSSLPEDHFVLSVCLTNLAYMLAADGDAETAVALLLDAHRRSLAAGRTGEAKIQRQRLVPLLRQLGRTEEADQFAK